jgi:hypothetical protein
VGTTTSRPLSSKTSRAAPPLSANLLVTRAQPQRGRGEALRAAGDLHPKGERDLRAHKAGKVRPHKAAKGLHERGRPHKAGKVRPQEERDEALPPDGRGRPKAGKDRLRQAARDRLRKAVRDRLHEKDRPGAALEPPP